MKYKVVFGAVILCIAYVFFAISLNISSEILTEAIRWSEIVIVMSFFAGLFKFMKNEMNSTASAYSEIKKSFSSETFTDVVKGLFSSRSEAANRIPNKETSSQAKGIRAVNLDKLLNSLIITISAIVTFILGFLDVNQGRYTFENIIREQPDFLAETTLVFIDGDEYLSRFPSRQKLALYISSDISADFFPTEDMLKKANLSSRSYKKLLKENMIEREKSAALPDGSDKEITFINDSDMKHVKNISEKIRSVSVEIISDILPTAEELRHWFDTSISSLKQKELDEGLEVSEKNRFSDFKIDNVTIQGSGTEFEKWFKSEKERLKNTSGRLHKEMFRYNDFVSNSGIAAMTAAGIPVTDTYSIGPEKVREISSGFFRTGVTTNHALKGSVRWIYRSIFDPLLSAFVALLLLNMLATAYRKFSVRSYSYCIITIAFCLTLIGFTNHYEIFAQNHIPGWQGPLSPDWLMKVFSVPVFRGLAIGTAAGLLFFVAENFYTTFFTRSKDKK